MTHSKEEMAKVWIDDEMTGKFPTNWREQVELGQEAFLAGFDAAEFRYKKALEIAENALNWIGAIEVAPKESWPEHKITAGIANDALGSIQRDRGEG